MLALGWAIARDVGKAAAPTFFRRMDPATAGTVGFVIRLVTLGITLLISMSVAGIGPSTIAVGGAFTAVIFGLAAQQTLGNLFAGMVLLSARPFRVGERVRLQAGAVGGSVEGIVSSLGLLYTELARGEDRVMIPNNVVLSAAVVPLREPDSVDVKVRLQSGIRPSHVQQILDDAISTPTRRAPTVLLEELDGDKLLVRVQATPERAADGAKLADQIIASLSAVTGEQALPETEAIRRPKPQRSPRLRGRSGAEASQRGRFSVARSACRPGRRPSARRSRSPPARRLSVAASFGATPAKTAPMRRPSGATSSSARFRSTARITAAATSCGERVPTPGGASRRPRRTSRRRG